MSDRPDYRRWYQTARWKRLREQVLTEQPLCSMCLEREYVVPATVVDHHEPHRGREELFWDRGNLVGLCKACHDKDKRLIENGRTVVRFDASGWPV